MGVWSSCGVVWVGEDGGEGGSVVRQRWSMLTVL